MSLEQEKFFEGKQDESLLLKKSVTKVEKKEEENQTIKYILALFCLVGICGTWVGMAEVSKIIDASGYEKPFFLTWLAHSGYIWFIPVSFIMKMYRPKPEALTNIHKFSLRNYLKAGVVISVIVFFMLYFWYLSLPRTSVSVNTAIYQSGCVFVYVFSVFMFKESVTILKVISVLFSVGGVFAISFSGGESSETGSAIGYVFLIVSTLLYALYEVVYRYLGVDPSDDKVEGFSNAILVLAIIGVSTLVIFWPGLILLHYTGVETFELPDQKTALQILLLVFQESMFNLCLLTGIFLTSPLLISVGSIMTIPVAITVDFLFHDMHLEILAYLGISFIVLGFFGLNFAEWLAQRELKKSQSKDFTTEYNSY